MQKAVTAEAEVILRGMPLGGGEQADISGLTARVTGEYPFAGEAARPAVQTVSFLKTLVEERGAEEEAPAVWDDPAGEADAADAATREAQIEAARQRGLATHRVLELLDFAQCDSDTRLQEQVAALVTAKLLSEAERDRADWRGIKWFLWHSTTGTRIIRAAREAAAGEVMLRREIPFAWIGTVEKRPELAEDMPTIRGVIDVLLVNKPVKTAEIVDYKTDSARLWQTRVDDYRRQMRYYMAAAGDVLGMKVERATLVFLAAQEEVVVEAKSGAA